MVVGAVVPYQHAEGHGKATGNVDRRDRNGDGAEHSCGGEATAGDGSPSHVFTPALAAPEVLALDLVHASDDDDACARHRNQDRGHSGAAGDGVAHRTWRSRGT